MSTWAQGFNQAYPNAFSNVDNTPNQSAPSTFADQIIQDTGQGIGNFVQSTENVLQNATNFGKFILIGAVLLGGLFLISELEK